MATEYNLKEAQDSLLEKIMQVQAMLGMGISHSSTLSTGSLQKDFESANCLPSSMLSGFTMKVPKIVQMTSEEAYRKYVKPGYKGSMAGEGCPPNKFEGFDFIHHDHQGEFDEFGYCKSTAVLGCPQPCWSALVTVVLDEDGELYKGAPVEVVTKEMMDKYTAISAISVAASQAVYSGFPKPKSKPSLPTIPWTEKNSPQTGASYRVIGEFPKVSVWARMDEGHTRVRLHSNDKDLGFLIGVHDNLNHKQGWDGIKNGDHFSITVNHDQAPVAIADAIYACTKLQWGM